MASEAKLACIAGAIFIAIDSLCSYTVINRWIRRWWKAMAAPDASQEELEKSISGISMRIVGMIHILIQVQPVMFCCYAPSRPACLCCVSGRQALTLAPVMACRLSTQGVHAECCKPHVQLGLSMHEYLHI